MPEIPGEWRSEQTWPAQGLTWQTWYPQTDHSLATKQSAEAVHRLKYIPSTGVDASGPDIWWGELTPDQRPDDAFSLVYDSASLQEQTAILGMLEVVLRASATAPQCGLVCASLRCCARWHCDPDHWRRAEWRTTDIAD
jgi:predicted acyl esterase